MGAHPSREVYSHANSQEILSLLWNQNVHYHVHKSHQPVPILSEPIAAYILKIYFPKIYLNIDLPSMPSLFLVMFSQIFLEGLRKSLRKFNMLVSLH
jgi:hypothetical protein